jgi:hypothetical protein
MGSGIYSDRVKAFVLLDFYVSAERTIIEEMRDITVVSQTRCCRTFEMDLGNDVVMTI